MWGLARVALGWIVRLAVAVGLAGAPVYMVANRRLGEDFLLMGTSLLVKSAAILWAVGWSLFAVWIHDKIGALRGVDTAKELREDNIGVGFVTTGIVVGSLILAGMVFG